MRRIHLAVPVAAVLIIPALVVVIAQVEQLGTELLVNPYVTQTTANLGMVVLALHIVTQVIHVMG